LSTGAEAEGSDIPSAVPVEDVTPEAQGAAGGVVCSLEIQDAEPIRLAPMSGAATSSRGGTELLVDDLVDPATVARYLEAVRQTEQWMKVSSRHL
jgi:hypothetical protein